MKKRYLLFVCMMTFGFLFAGCGKNNGQDLNITPTPLPAVTETPAPSPTEAADLVEMEKTEEEKNLIGNKTATALKTEIVNQTGAEVSEIYIRKNTEDMDDSEWGKALINGKFTLKEGESAVYYFERSAIDADENSATKYDIRIVYINSDRTENYFRQIPLTEINKITLRMDESDWGYIPYATYLKNNGTSEYSTLEEVKERLGYYDSDSEPEAEESANDYNEVETVPVQEEETEQPEEGDEVDAIIQAAEGCIGSSLDTLINTIGEPQGSDYEDEPESGETGYHYYDSFTVYTSVDENGNEIVAGVW